MWKGDCVKQAMFTKDVCCFSILYQEIGLIHRNSEKQFISFFNIKPSYVTSALDDFEKYCGKIEILLEATSLNHFFHTYFLKPLQQTTFWKHYDKMRNCSKPEILLLPQCFKLCSIIATFAEKLSKSMLQIYCMWERVYITCHLQLNWVPH